MKQEVPILANGLSPASTVAFLGDWAAPWPWLGLRSAPQHNGKREIVRSFNAGTGRCTMRLPLHTGPLDIKVKPANVFDGDTAKD